MIEIKFGQINENDKDKFLPEWTLGSCYGPKYEVIYDENEIHYERCCLLPGRHTLTCINRKSEFGWGNVTFKINEKRFCDDFIGYKAMRTMLVEGKKYVSTIKCGFRPYFIGTS